MRVTYSVSFIKHDGNMVSSITCRAVKEMKPATGRLVIKPKCTWNKMYV